MSQVNNTCPKCGANMQFKNGSFVCGYCGAMVLNVIDAKIDDDVTVMSADEFEKAIQSSATQIVVKIDDEIKIIDAHTAIANKRIGDAKEKLEQGDFNGVIDSLSIVEGEHLSVARLRILAMLGVKNEAQIISNDFATNSRKLEFLSSLSGNLANSEQYAIIIKLADNETQETYKKISEFCLSQYLAYVDLQTKSADVKALVNEGLKDEAILFAKNLCRTYPHNALSWKTLCETLNAFNPKANLDNEYSKLIKCPDYNENMQPVFVISRATQLRQTYKATHYPTGKLILWTALSFMAFILFMFCLNVLEGELPAGIIFEILHVILIIISGICLGFCLIKLVIYFTKWLRPHIALIKAKQGMPSIALGQIKKEPVAIKTLVFNILELVVIAIFTVVLILL